MKKKRKIKLVLLILFVGGFFSVFFLKTGFTVNQIADWQNFNNRPLSPEKLPELPKDDPERLNLLLLGVRGAEEEGEGNLLSDTNIVVSIKKKTGAVALISLPRDIYAIIYCIGEKQKINFAYAQGGIDCAKKTIGYITGQYIDYAVSVDFTALTEIVDTLGGIDVSLDEPFEESFQWAKEGIEENERWFIKEIDGEEKWVFYLPKGANHLDGQTALYYARSRYSTNDFDRMRRQQEIIMAIKDKALSLEMLNSQLFIGMKEKKVLRKESVIVDNQRAMHTILTCEIDNHKLKVESYVIEFENKVYDLVYWAPSDSFDYVREDFKSIVKSFKFLNL